jgi:hypothetical protein
MRKFQKHQLLELLGTLKEATDELFKPGNKHAVSALIGDITDFVSALVEYAKKLVSGEQADKAVKFLNDYVTMLTSLDKVELKNQIHNIELEFSKFKVDKIQLVFVADCMSKADALLPIYKIAKDDPACEAHFIPIPLYELDPQMLRIRAKMLFENEDEWKKSYPWLEITDWQTFDLEKNKPDVIFTNNAYDDENYVTQTHPTWWCKNLKNHTECLVFIPYFVLDNNQFMTVFAKLTAFRYADLVVLENEKVRKLYVDNAMDCFGKTLNYSKFVALGSPKFDMVLEYTQKAKDGTLEIPDEWKSKIYKTDGTKKKLVFYNTSLGALLADAKENDPSYLQGSLYVRKVAAVLDTFKRRAEGKGDVVLLWRPHPLMLSTIHSMAPHLSADWGRIVENYKRENYGIYDESGDLHRAIAVSDCYYGDGSSVSALFRQLDKKIYFQYFDNKQKINLIPWNGFFVDCLFKVANTLYAKSNTDYIFTKNDGLFDFVSSLPTVPRSEEWHRFFLFEVVDNNVWLFPNNDTQLVSYDAVKNCCESYTLSLKDEYTNISEDGCSKHFCGGVFYKNKVFLVPNRYGAVVAYNFDTKETEHCLDLRGRFGEEKFCSWQWLNDTTVLIPSRGTNEVLEFNLETYEYKVRKLGRTDRYYHSIYKYGDDYFLVGMQPFVAKLNYQTGSFNYYNKLPSGFKTLKQYNWTFVMNNIKPYKNKLILFGGFTNMVLEFDLETCEYRKLDAFDALLIKEAGDSLIDSYPFTTANLLDGENLYFVWKYQTLYSYNFETESLQELSDLKVNFKESEIEQLSNEFIDDIVKKTDNNKKSELQPCSGKIYDYVKKLVGVGV